MKKISILLVTVLCTVLCCLPASAVCPAEPAEVIYFEDGSYLEIGAVTEGPATRATNTKSGQKSIVYRSESGREIWQATLSATFTYTGSSATCTVASITTSITDSNWKITEKTATKSGNKAIGDITAKRYFLGIATKTVEQSVTITCSAAGVLS
ncbi:MAG: hypothetical protein IJ043_04810 [Clostridia bacterium]|nr:hypothetical protein [Clostridia bacterium]